MFYFELDGQTELRPFIESDAEEVFVVVKANIEHLNTFLHWATPNYDLEAAREFIRLAQLSAAEKVNQSLGIFVGGKLVGSVGFVSFNWISHRTEIGYWIAKDFERRGLITKSCRKLIDYAFEKLEMNRIEIRCATENSRSRAIPEKLNFKSDGILRQSEWRHNRFYDMAIYSLLREEWRTFSV